MNARPAAGFTLIELMVVLAIIGLFLVPAALNFNLGGDDVSVQRETQRLQRLINMAREEALIDARERGLAVTADGYGFYEITAEGWRPAKDSVFQTYALPEDLRLTLDIEGQPAELGYDKPEAPQIVLWASGETTPFLLKLRHSDSAAAFAIAADPAGRIEVVTSQ